MNKTLTILGSSFFILEVIVITVYLLDISMSVDQLVGWACVGAVNIAGLILLLSGLFRKE